MNYYVEIKSPESLFHTSLQKCVPTGKTRTTENGIIEAQFVPISKGYYKELFWVDKTHLYTPSPDKPIKKW